MIQLKEVGEKVSVSRERFPRRTNPTLMGLLGPNTEVELQELKL